MIFVLFCVTEDIRTIVSSSNGITELRYKFRKRYLVRMQVSWEV